MSPQNASVSIDPTAVRRAAAHMDSIVDTSQDLAVDIRRAITRAQIGSTAPRTLTTIDQELSELAHILRNRANLAQNHRLQLPIHNFALSGNGSAQSPEPNSLSVTGPVTDFLLGDVANFWNGGEGGLPTGQGLAALLKIARVRKWIAAGAAGPVPVFSNGALGTALANTLGSSNVPSLARAGAWLGSPGAVTAFKWAGVAGGVAATGAGLYDLYQQGDPRDAYQANGAGYVADIASTAFSASGTAFLLAPNPVTGALVIGTGVIWVGAELYDHREEIAEFASDAWDSGSELVSDVGEGALSILDDVGSGASGLLGSVSKIGDWF